MTILETPTGSHADADHRCFLLLLSYRRAQTPPCGDRCPHPKVDEGEGKGALCRKSRRCVPVILALACRNSISGHLYSIACTSSAAEIHIKWGKMDIFFKKNEEVIFKISIYAIISTISMVPLSIVTLLVDVPQQWMQGDKKATVKY